MLDVVENECGQQMVYLYKDYYRDGQSVRQMDRKTDLIMFIPSNMAHQLKVGGCGGGGS